MDKLFPPRNAWLPALLAVAVIVAGPLIQAGAELWVPDKVIEKSVDDYGYRAQRVLTDWRDQLRRLSGRPEDEQLQGVNDFINKNLPFVSDRKQWRQEDYWATPYESLGSGGGDCEDYVIAKYYSLIKLGVDTAKLRITYVKALRYNEAHMVLTYFPTPDAVPYVLDNLIKTIEPASRRDDLAPVYSFNGEGMWLERMKGEGIRMGNPNKLDLWTDLRVRMSKLGMDL